MYKAILEERGKKERETVGKVADQDDDAAGMMEVKQEDDKTKGMSEWVGVE